MKGQFSDAHPLCANAAPDCLASADLVILVGQHQMPNLGEFAFGPNVKYIRMDTNAEDMGRNLPIDVAIVTDEKVGLEALAEALPRLKHETWVAEVAAARKKFEDENDSYGQMGMKYTDAVHPGVIAKGMSDFLYKGKIPKEQTVVVNGGYGVARYVRRVVRGYRPGQILNAAYQYAAVGPDIAYGFGAAAAVQNGSGVQAAYRGHTVVCVTGDAGFGYSAMEIDTIAKYRVPLVIVVYNNNAWGTWTGAQTQPRSMGIHLFQENLRYDKLCEALGGGQSEYVTRPEDFVPALARAYDTATKGSVPVVVNAQGKKEFWLKDKFPPGNLGKVEPGCMSYYH
jgi:thiamine pyrophosphate-dependent acetolactate synthase large subunit-like protein